MIRKFLPTSQAAQYLGRKRNWLMSRVRSGTFKKQNHYRNVSDGMRPTYEFDVIAIEKWLDDIKV
jgi:hypothetical protein